MTGRVTLAAAEMASESHPLRHGIRAINAAVCSEDDTVRRCAKGIYEAPKANMYQVCQNMNNTVMFSSTYDIVYIEGTVNNQVSMEWLPQCAKTNTKWCQWRSSSTNHSALLRPSASSIVVHPTAKMEYT